MLVVIKTMTPTGCIDLRDVDEGKFYGFGAVIEGCKRRIVRYGADYFWYDDQREQIVGYGAPTVKKLLDATLSDRWNCVYAFRTREEYDEWFKNVNP